MQDLMIGFGCWGEGVFQTQGYTMHSSTIPFGKKKIPLKYNSCAWVENMMIINAYCDKCSHVPQRSSNSQKRKKIAKENEAELA